MASLEAHAAYIDGLGWENFDAREFLEGFGRQTGQRLGRRHGGGVRGVPDGLGRVAHRSSSPARGAESSSAPTLPMMAAVGGITAATMLITTAAVVDQNRTTFQARTMSRMQVPISQK